jgi:hypothetical protein
LNEKKVLVENEDLTTIVSNIPEVWD